MTDQTPQVAPSMWRLLPIAVIAVVAIAGAVLLRDLASFETLRAHRMTLLEMRDANFLLASLLFIAVYTVIVTFSLPGAAIASITGGFLFAIFPGTLFNMVAATAGATAIFLAARWGVGDFVGARLEATEGAVKRIKDGIDENQWSMLFMIRLLPIVPFFVANLVPAFLEVALHRFVISTFFGIVPGALVYTSLGSGLGDVFERGETPDLGVIFEPQILLPILGLCALAGLPILLRRMRRNGGAG